MMCNDCGAVFEYPDVYEERHGLSSPPYERFLVCPECRSEDLYED